MRRQGIARSSPTALYLLAFLVAVSSHLAATPTFAAGYGLKEHSADAMASAYAGAAATQGDASYLAYNPASLAGVVGHDFSFSAVEILPGSKGSYSVAMTSAATPTGGSLRPSGFISDAMVPAFGFRQRLSDSWAVGLSISAPWGLRTDYPSTWAGRYYAQKSSLLTINTMPVLSYQPMPGLALGAGLQIEYAQGKLTSAIDTGTLGALNAIPFAVPGGQDSFAALSGKSWTVGYTLGVIEHFDDLSIGLSYRSSLQHDLKGSLTFTLDGAGVGALLQSASGLFANTRQITPLTMPDMIEFGLRNDFSDAWSGMLEVDWTHWSRVHELRVQAANLAQPDDVTTLRWRDAFFASAGAEYRPHPDWIVRAGVGYDQSPTQDLNREPRIPDADRVWLSAGVRYHLTDAMDVNVTASRLFNLEQKIALDPSVPGAALRGTLLGTTQSYVNVAGVQLSFRPD